MGRGARRRPRRLAPKLREVRRGLRLSQGALIERMGVENYINQGEISDFEHGVREPDLLTLKAYADAAGVSIDCLIDDYAKLPDKLPGAKYRKGTGGRLPPGRFPCRLPQPGAATQQNQSYCDTENDLHTSMLPTDYVTDGSIGP